VNWIDLVSVASDVAIAFHSISSLFAVPYSSENSHLLWRKIVTGEYTSSLGPLSTVSKLVEAFPPQFVPVSRQGERTFRLEPSIDSLSPALFSLFSEYRKKVLSPKPRFAISISKIIFSSAGTTSGGYLMILMLGSSMHFVPFSQAKVDGRDAPQYLQSRVRRS
jgi:hypothetical protein